MNIEILCHSSIKIESQGKIIYSDPFRVKESKNDADIIIITHSHYDHFSEEDIIKVKNEKTKILVTNDLLEKTLELGFNKEDITVVIPNNVYQVLGIEINTIPAYNENKKFHPKTNNWVGYMLNLENQKIYVAGDTDVTEENKCLKCDIALVPIGGTYTMSYKEAAGLINNIKPKKVIPMHYAEIVGNKEDGIKFKENVDNNIDVEIQI
jgi:L-ascorbate metabolism protein UlaG (beta-lactamase superfamily)